MIQTWFLLAAVSYLIGSLPTGLIIARVIGGVDIRQYGSGNVGAANIQRTLGWNAFVVVLLVDMAKGAAAVYAAWVLLPAPEAQAMAGLVAMAGHNWPVFTRFRGGRGASTAFGALLMMTPAMFLVGVCIAVTITMLSRYVSLAVVAGSTVLALAVGISVLLGREPLAYLIYLLVAIPMLWFQHRENIRRLFAGRERRIGERGKPRPSFEPGNVEKG